MLRPVRYLAVPATVPHHLALGAALRCAVSSARRVVATGDDVAAAATFECSYCCVRTGSRSTRRTNDVCLAVIRAQGGPWTSFLRCLKRCHLTTAAAEHACNRATRSRRAEALLLVIVCPRIGLGVRPQLCGGRSGPRDPGASTLGRHSEGFCSAELAHWLRAPLYGYGSLPL